MMTDEIRSESNRSVGQHRVIRSGMWIGGTAIALLVGLAVSAGAMGLFGGRHARPGGFMGHGGPHGARAEFAVDWALTRVDATEEQRDLVKARIGDSMAAMHELHQRHRGNREAWINELGQPVLDRAALEGLRVQELALADAASQRFLGLVADVGDILTIEQRAELIELAQDFHGRRRHHQIEAEAE
jgi:protein CpxP